MTRQTSRFLMAALVFAMLFLASVHATDLTDLTGDDWDRFFETNRDNIIQAENFQKKKLDTVLHWMDKDQNTLETKTSSMTAFGQQTEKVAVRFFNNTPEEVSCIFYNRLNHKYRPDGNKNREIEVPPTKEEFDACVESLTKSLTDLTGGEPIRHKTKISKETPTMQNVWTKNKIAFVLRVRSQGSKKDFIAEFIDLRIFPFNDGNDPTKASYTNLAKKNVVGGKGDLKKNVKRDDDGSVIIENIPFVAHSGYNTPPKVALLERVVRYYGNETLTQNDFANMFQTERYMGFSRFVKLFGNKIGVKMGDEWHQFNNRKEYVDFFGKYNKKASRAKKEKVDLDYFNHDKKEKEVIREMDPDIVREMRAEDKQGFKKFKKTVMASIDAGIPIFFTLQYLWGDSETRITKQTNDTTRLVLIDGYNAKEDEVYFMNPWKKEKSTLKFPEAWMMSLDLYTIVPK